MKKKVVLSVAVVLLVVMVAAMCVACTPNADSLTKKLEKKDYKVVNNPILGKDMEKAIVASNGEEMLYVTWYKTSDAAKEAYDKAKDGKEDMKQLFSKDVEFKVAKKGNAVAVGTKNAIKLF